MSRSRSRRARMCNSHISLFSFVYSFAHWFLIEFRTFILRVVVDGRGQDSDHSGEIESDQWVLKCKWEMKRCFDAEHVLQINERIKQIDNKPFFYREKCIGSRKAEAASFGINWTKRMFSGCCCTHNAFCVHAYVQEQN